MKPRVFKTPDGYWASSWAGSFTWGSYVPNVVYVKCHETWEEALYYANARVSYEVLRKELT